MIVKCQKCGAELELPAEVENGQHVRCPYCNLLSSVQLSLIELDSLPTEKSAKLPEFVVATTGREYEECINNFLKANGYNSILTPESGDKGVDIVVHLKNLSVAIQCKLYSSPVGNDAVQEVVAGANYYNCGVACVVSNASFTSSAVSLSVANNVKLLHHSELFKFIVGLEDCKETGNAFPPDFESTDEYSSLVERANQGYDDARKRLGEYYKLQMMRYVNEDLIVASDYYLKACCVGCAEAIAAYLLYKDENLKDNSYKIVLDDIWCDVSSVPLEILDEVATEACWGGALSCVANAVRLPNGRQREAILAKIPFVKEYGSREHKTAKQMYYLGECYRHGWGCNVNYDVASYYFSIASVNGYRVAAKLISEVNGSVEIGKQIVQAKMAKIPRYTKCLRCGAGISTDSQFCWSCNAPVPGWTGKKLEF